jgi:anti-anti-sigma factor
MAPTPSHAEFSVPAAAEQGLLVTIEDSGTPARCLRVRGELDLATVGLLRCVIDRAAAGRQEVELDLSGVTFCDVIGASVLERAQQQLQARGCRLTLHGLDRPLHLLLAVDGLFSTLRRSAPLDRPKPPGAG